MTKSSIITVFIMLVFGCGHPMDDGSESLSVPSPSGLNDQTLLKVHQVLYSGVEVEGCKVKTTKTWNGLRHSLGVTFTQEDPENHKAETLDFATSSHITSRVKIRRFLFSEQIKSLVFEKVNILEVPKTPKSVIEIHFSKDGKAKSIEKRTFIGSNWNLTAESICGQK